MVEAHFVLISGRFHQILHREFHRLKIPANREFKKKDRKQDGGAHPSRNVKAVSTTQCVDLATWLEVNNKKTNFSGFGNIRDKFS